MPAIFIDGCSQLRDILRRLNHLPPCHWLISELQCYDYYGWDGCEKWAQETLFLSDDELRHDMEIENPQIIWGAFSALPADTTKDQAYAYTLPWLDGNTNHLRDHIFPQHPLAFLEIASIDSSYLIVSSRDASLLEPLYDLPYATHDEEIENQIRNACLRRIQTVLRKFAPTVSDEQANEIQWNCWRKLFYHPSAPVEDAALLSAVQEEYARVSQCGCQYRQTVWNPFDAD